MSLGVHFNNKYKLFGRYSNLIYLDESIIFKIFAFMWRGIKECFFIQGFTLIFPNTWCFKKCNYEVRNKLMSYTINLHTQKAEAGEPL